jgi:transposase-like protein
MADPSPASRAVDAQRPTNAISDDADRVPNVECPFCGEPYSKVVDTMEGARRRRECRSCGRRYNTREHPISGVV